MTRSPAAARAALGYRLGSEKNFGKLMEYECGLEEMFRDLPALSGICQYDAPKLKAILFT